MNVTNGNVLKKIDYNKYLINNYFEQLGMYHALNELNE